MEKGDQAFQLTEKFIITRCRYTVTREGVPGLKLPSILVQSLF